MQKIIEVIISRPCMMKKIVRQTPVVYFTGTLIIPPGDGEVRLPCCMRNEGTRRTLEDSKGIYKPRKYEKC